MVEPQNDDERRRIASDALDDYAGYMGVSRMYALQSMLEDLMHDWGRDGFRYAFERAASNVYGTNLAHPSVKSLKDMTGQMS